MVVVSLVITFILPMAINHTAHIGGLVVGVGVGAFFADGAPAKSRSWHRVAASLCVLASLGALLAARLSPYYDAIVAAG
jgi:membrane associated rhomboid family serine protease